MKEQDALTPEEKSAFEALPNIMEPPLHLEDTVVTALKEEGLIKKQRTMHTYFKYAAGLAASVLIFFAGNFLGKQNNLVEIDPLQGYMMILKEDAAFQPGDPMAMFEEYAAWMNNLYDKGIKITGQELKNEAWSVTKAGSRALGQEADTKVTGYFLIEAKSEEEALAVVRDNPHLKYGGTIELKAFMNR